MKERKKTIKKRGYALLAAGLESLQLVFLTRGEAVLARNERLDVYKTFIVPCTITYQLVPRE